jgi:hypothetical protein
VEVQNTSTYLLIGGIMKIDYDALAEESVKINQMIDKIAEDIIGLSKLCLDNELTNAIKLALLDAYFCGKSRERKPAQLKNKWSAFINQDK